MTGRPSKYDPAFCEQARKLCELGATDVDVADFFNVGITTIKRWGSTYPEFRAALKVGKADADDRVERSLYQKAIGYTFDSEKVFQFQGQIVRAATREHVPPDTTACIFWLKNRRPDLWRDKHDMQVTGKDGGAVKIEEVGEMAREKLVHALDGIAARTEGNGHDKDEARKLHS